MHEERVRAVEEGAVLVDQVDSDVVVVRPVGVRVALRAVRAVGVTRAVAPVDDVARDRVRARIADRSQGQGVRRAFVDVGRPADRD